MKKEIDLIVNQDACLEIFNIGTGVFDPLKGFMDSADYKNVVENMHLKDGMPWTIPVTLDVPENDVNAYIRAEKVILRNTSGEIVTICPAGFIFMYSG